MGDLLMVGSRKYKAVNAWQLSRITHSAIRRPLKLAAIMATVWATPASAVITWLPDSYVPQYGVPVNLNRGPGEFSLKRHGWVDPQRGLIHLNQHGPAGRNTALLDTSTARYRGFFGVASPPHDPSLTVETYTSPDVEGILVTPNTPLTAEVFTVHSAGKLGFDGGDGVFSRHALVFNRDGDLLVDSRRYFSRRNGFTPQSWEFVDSTTFGDDASSGRCTPSVGSSGFGFPTTAECADLVGGGTSISTGESGPSDPTDRGQTGFNIAMFGEDLSIGAILLVTNDVDFESFDTMAALDAAGDRTPGGSILTYSGLNGFAYGLGVGTIDLAERDRNALLGALTLSMPAEIQPNVVPLPGTLVLSVSTLATLAAFRRRKA